MDYEAFEKEVARLNPADTCTVEIDGKPENMISVRGFVLIACKAWVQDDNPQCRDVLYEYCRYINQQGYPVNAATALRNLRKMSVMQRKMWILSTFDKYATDQTRLVKVIALAMGLRKGKRKRKN